MTPQSISQRARELWEIAKAQDGWDDSMRMAYIMGACDGMADVMEKFQMCNPSNGATINASTNKECESPLDGLYAFIKSGM